MKVIEKPTIEKTRRRHPNVDNEIMMEKKVTTTYTLQSLFIYAFANVIVIIVNCILRLGQKLLFSC